MMAYHDGHAPSWASKLTLLGLVLIGTVYSVRITEGHDQLNATRQFLLVACTILFFVRLAVCLVFFVERKVSQLEGTLVGILYCGMLCAFAYWAGRHPASIAAVDLPGVALYLGGSWINTVADYQRHVWKRRPENAGHVYTQGLFRHATHINFFGDTLAFLGFALITHEIVSLVPPTAIILNFIFLQIPQLDSYLTTRYGQEFVEYASKTRKYVPFIY
jgi:protein-S-isoprenylcysteine O-methyltransferase Ste14